MERDMGSEAEPEPSSTPKLPLFSIPMGSEAEPEPSSTPKLPLFSISIPPMQSPEPSGMLTPPLHTIASVPFRWEEEPGKPRPCTTLTTTNQKSVRCLELPPRLLTEVMITKMPSPTTVLEGPYMANKPVFQSSSFRVSSSRDQLGDGFFGCSGGSPERGLLGPMILSKRSGLKEKRGLFGSWGRRTLNLKGKRDSVGGDSFVFSSSVERESDGGGYGSESGSGTSVKRTSIRRSGSFLGLSHPRSHFWATVYEGLKQVIPWKSRKLKKDGSVV